LFQAYNIQFISKTILAFKKAWGFTHDFSVLLRKTIKEQQKYL